MQSLHHRAFKGVAWSALERFGLILLRFVIQLVLARLLGPEAFGLIALAIVFEMIGIGIMDSGLTQVIIQRDDLDDRDLSTIFYANLALGGMVTALLVLISPLVADFYNEPTLSNVLMALSTCVMLTALGRVQMSRMSKLLEFKRIAMATIPSFLLSGALGIFCALNGYGVWSLVVYNVTQAGLANIALWFFGNWRPVFAFDWSRLCSFLPFGLRMVCVRIVNLFAENLLFLIAGKLFNPIQVGFLQRAQSLRMVASNTPVVVIERVIFPLFSQLQGDQAELRKTYLGLLPTYALLFAIMMAVLAALASPLIELLLGHEWLPTIVFLQWMCPMGLLYTLHRMGSVLIKAAGRADRLLTLTLIEHGVTLLTLLLCAFWGIIPMLVCQTIGNALTLLLKLKEVRHLINVSIKDQLACVGHAICIALFVGFCALLPVFIDLPNSIHILISTVLATCGVIACLFLFRVRYAQELEFACKRIPFLSRFSAYLIL